MDISQIVLDRPDEGIFRVHRSAMTSPDILSWEQERVFERSWLYVGHESEVKAPGDYRRRTVAGRPLILWHGSDGQIRVFYNSCRHRGAALCRQDEGSQRALSCFYHAWTFNNQGELIDVPDAAGYADSFDRKQFGLMSPPRVEQYRGLYFVSFQPDIVDLPTYLGPARELIDLTVDSATALGGWAVLRGTLKYTIKCNWKLLVENSYDGYHLQSVHHTYLEYMSWRREQIGVQGSNQRRASRAFALSHGHGGMIHRASGRAIANPGPLWSDEVNGEVLRIQNDNIDRFGEARGRQMSEVSRHMLIFPNLAFQDSHTGFRLRLIWPVAPDLVDVVQWDLAPREERRELHESRMENSLAFLGPGGLATPDDVEALEACQVGFGAREVEWSDISRGMKREPLMTDELQMRGFWRHWHALMQGKAAADGTDDRPRSGTTFLGPDAA
jgi:p-cumate 2,3-dioxygenase subunit alpha